MTLIQVKGHEPKQYYALWFIAGLLYNFTSVKMKGPNKTFRTNENYILFYSDPDFICTIEFLTALNFHRAVLRI